MMITRSSYLKQIGTVLLKCSTGRTLSLRECLYAPNANMRLISTGKLENNGMHTHTGPSSFLVTDSDGRVVVHGSRQPDSLYYVSGISCQPPLANIARAVPNLSLVVEYLPPSTEVRTRH